MSAALTTSIDLLSRKPAGGASVALRQIRADDAAALQAFVRALSPASRRLRFHMALNELTESALQALTRVDQHAHVAFVLTTTERGAERIVGEARYVVVDYKTNWLGGFGPAGAEPLTAWDYRPEAMAAEMIRAHYPLQALLYSVALHRFLRWRQPVYDPTTHLGGVLYLFLRGMCGPETPVVGGVPCGVFSWQPPAGLIQDVSDLLDRGAP